MKPIIITFVAILTVIIYCFIANADEILDIARGEIGNGETIANNKGPDIDKYFLDNYEGAWCGAFVSWVLNQAGVTELGISSSSRELFNRAKEIGWVVDEPKPGDLIVLWRKKKNSWKGHIGIVEQVWFEGEKGFKIVSIEGNKGAFPAKVKRVMRRSSLTTGIPKLLGYIRIGGE